MTNDSVTGYWTATSSAAQPGQEYKYFLRWPGNTVGSWKQDPRAVWIRNGNSVIYDQSAFAWGTVTRPSIPVEQQIMYEMHIGTFYDPDPSDQRPGTFDDAISRLDYLKRLGVNVVALMPVNEFGGDRSWGYNPAHPFAIESAYGGPDGLKRFVQAAHQKGLKVQLDVVHNHWNPADDGMWEFDGTNNIYFYGDEPIGWTAWGRRPNYSQPEVQRLIRENIQMLLDDFRVDGFRWDSPQNLVGYDATATRTNTNNKVEYAIGNPQTVILSGKDLMAGINRMIRTNSAYTNRWSVAEDAELLVPTNIVVYPTNTFQGQLQVTNTNETFHGHWQTSFHNEITPQIAATNPSLAIINGKINEWSEPPGWRVIFTDNHDKSGDWNIGKDSNSPVLGWRLPNRMDPTNQTLTAGATNLIRTNSMIDPVVRKRVLLNAVLMFTAPGVPMIWMGQEFGATDTFTDKNRMNWREASRQSEIFRAHRDLVFLRTNLQGLRLLSIASSNNTFTNGGVLAYWHTNGTPANDVYVALNFSGNNTNLLLSNLPSSTPNTSWYLQLHTDWNLYGGTSPISTNSLTISNLLSLPPYSAAVLAKNPSGIQLSNLISGLPEGWLNLFGITDPNADDDRDGMSAAFEYQNGLDPLERDVATISFDNGATSTPMRSYAEPLNATNQYLLWTAYAGTNMPLFQIGSRRVVGGVFTNPARTYLRFTYNLTNTNSTTSFFTPNTNLAMVDTNRTNWARFHGITDFTMDPDGDSFSSLQEFARGSDPNVWNRTNLYLAGTYNGWNESSSPMVFLGNSQWVRYFWVTNGSSHEFKVTTGSWSTAWGETNNPPDFIADLLPSAANIKFNCTNGTGFYRFDFDESTLAYRLALDNNATEMTIVGTGFAFSTTASNTMANNMAWNNQRGQFEWTGTATSNLAGFRFVRPLADANWDVSWGRDSASPTTKVLPNTSPNNSANTTNISVNLASGARYRISLKPADLSMGISLTPDQIWLNSNNPSNLPSSSFWGSDIDGDGYTQLVEYALNGNPANSADGTTLQTLSTDSTGGTNRLVLQWLERTNGESSLQVTPILATNLMDPVASWFLVQSYNATNTNGVPANFVRKEAWVPIDSATNRKFLRLRVTGP